MKTEQSIWTAEKGWNPALQGIQCKKPQLIFVFGNSHSLKNNEIIDQIKTTYPKAFIWGCSTAGEIYGTQVHDDSIVATIVEFEHTEIKSTHTSIEKMKDSFSVGEKLAKTIDHDGLVHLMVLSDGLQVNGSNLVKGLSKNLDDNVSITGGLSGDGASFEKTFVLHDGILKSGIVSVVGFYGTRLKVGYGSMGGWDSFGPERLVTKSTGNILYEMDGRSALELYKEYLGKHADGLPATGLLFPLSVRLKEGEKRLVRTILNVDEENNSMTFAGDVPEGAYVQLMKANFDRLIDGAEGAAKISYEGLGSSNPDLALLISCVGRKMILKQRVEEEVEDAAAVFGDKTRIMGFYSYGEISPFDSNSKCELHNQTMTITLLQEI